MNQYTRFFSLSLLSVAMLAPATQAAVSAEEAANLGQDLTPIGAERAGNADGSIPVWAGGLPKDVGTMLANGTPSDVFADEQPLFTVDASNYERYRELLTDGQVALLNRYPDSYRLPVYPTHRSVGIPDKVAAEAARNATHTNLVNDGNGLADFQGNIAFPIPRNGAEVVWNHLTRYRGGSKLSTTDSVAPQPNGDYVITTIEARSTPVTETTDFKPEDAAEVLFYYSHKITAPARQAGSVLLVHETIDQVASPRRTWLYTAGQRRVRRAPSIAYDAAGPATAGLRTADGLDMYNGAPDRYEWKLIGKKELLIPYNSYRLASPEVSYQELVQPGHLAADHTRYERHRVWEVVATLKDGQRHIYSQRRFYIDEDSWAIIEADHYDTRGELWRIAESHTYYQYAQQALLSAADVIHDLQNGRYLAVNLTNEQREAYRFDYRASTSDYSPGALRSRGVR
ncbi:DUF1329 domain-containing protein [Halopseudomonas pelagia]|uniref:DUF1329 domain-containing protein n=1 Tax=Halopseudomonas pelagia TaxID=553151 RepID=A0AA91Z4S7_9GAMM|nr:DUF1329 domain-containing protein [Halopseudomonas pelagia]PCC98163.1 outer membrane lipoprotein-sorting protein [Halopseudomonas pelagia]QFY57315.1 DUF1329 domain-containing protein [Halopseudomonas pelagia]